MIARKHESLVAVSRGWQAYCLLFHQRCLCASQYHYSILTI